MIILKDRRISSYAFGSPKNLRQFNLASARVGFNGKENDNDVKGTGNQQDYGMRIYDPRLGKFLSIDPLAYSYPFYTPYLFAGNKPIVFVDIDGLEEGERAANAGEALSKSTNEIIETALTKLNLGPYERIVVRANPFDAYKSQTTNSMAFDVQLAAGFGFKEDGAGDAFRHTLWNALMTKKGNKDFAQKMGVAHEKDNPNKKEITTKMDLYNNMVGQNLAEDNPGATDKELALMTLEKVYKGEAYMAEKNKKGEDVLGKSSLTKEEYNSAKKAIEAIDFPKLETDSKKSVESKY